MASAATATREYAAASATTNTPCPTSLCRPTRARPLPVTLHPHTTPVSTAPPTRPAPITTMVQTLAHTPTPFHIPCPPASCLSHNTMVQTGRHPNELRLRFLVRYISMKFRPSPAEFIHATTAFPCPNWPQLHPTKTPTHAPTAQPATSSRLTVAVATAKSPSDAGATATVVDATTVATTSDLRRHWRPHLPPVLQQVVELPPHSCGQGHNLRRAPSLQDCHNQLVRSDADPLPVFMSFLSWGTLRATCIHAYRSV